MKNKMKNKMKKSAFALGVASLAVTTPMMVLATQHDANNKRVSTSGQKANANPNVSNSLSEMEIGYVNITQTKSDAFKYINQAYDDLVDTSDWAFNDDWHYNEDNGKWNVESPTELKGKLEKAKIKLAEWKIEQKLKITIAITAAQVRAIISPDWADGWMGSAIDTLNNDDHLGAFNNINRYKGSLSSDEKIKEFFALDNNVKGTIKPNQFVGENSIHVAHLKLTDLTITDGDTNQSWLQGASLYTIEAPYLKTISTQRAFAGNGELVNIKMPILASLGDNGEASKGLFHGDIRLSVVNFPYLENLTKNMFGTSPGRYANVFDSFYLPSLDYNQVMRNLSNDQSGNSWTPAIEPMSDGPDVTFTVAKYFEDKNVPGRLDQTIGQAMFGKDAAFNKVTYIFGSAKYQTDWNTAQFESTNKVSPSDDGALATAIANSAFYNDLYLNNYQTTGSIWTDFWTDKFQNNNQFSGPVSWIQNGSGWHPSDEKSWLQFLNFTATPIKPEVNLTSHVHYTEGQYEFIYEITTGIHVFNIEDLGVEGPTTYDTTKRKSFYVEGHWETYVDKTSYKVIVDYDSETTNYSLGSIAKVGDTIENVYKSGSSTAEHGFLPGIDINITVDGKEFDGYDDLHGYKPANGSYLNPNGTWRRKSPF